MIAVPEVVIERIAAVRGDGEGLPELVDAAEVPRRQRHPERRSGELGPRAEVAERPLRHRRAKGAQLRGEDPDEPREPKCRENRREEVEHTLSHGRTLYPMPRMVVM